MKADPFWDDSLELERYELREILDGPWLPDRRAFLGTLGAGLFVLCLRRESSAQEPRRGRDRRREGEATPREVGAWLRIAEDGQVTAYTGKVEVGQNARTSLTQALADELRVPPETVRMVMGDTDLVPYDRGTFGSRTTPTMVPQLRRAAAAARRKLIELAAEQLGVDGESLVAEEGHVHHQPTGKALRYGDLTGGQQIIETIEDDEATTPADHWTVAGHPLPKVDGRDFVTGRHRFTTDLTRPGMLFGKILRPPAFGAHCTKLDTRAAEAIDGVVVVHDGDFIGVAAPDEPTANRALAALRADWTMPGSALSDVVLFDTFRARLDTTHDEKVAKGLKEADARVEASYTIAYIAHTPLEPRAALAEWEGDRLTVWTGTQRPFGVRQELVRAFGLPPVMVRVIMPDTGGGFGGKHTGEAAIEAARLARAAKKPVKLNWTRQEEFTWAYFRPGGLIQASAGVKKDGSLCAWEFQNVNSGGSGIETPYEVSAHRVAVHDGDSPLRQGSYRALASTANHFARESLMDELADQIQMDPLEFRRKNLPDGRLRDVLEAAAERFGWGRPKGGENRGVGLACGTEKGSFVATCAEVAIDRGQVRVVRAVTAFDCGAVNNPDHLKNQIEGAMVMGLGGALFEAIRFADGQILNNRLARYRVPRFGDVPMIEVVLLDRKDLPSAGAGETPIVTIAPAIGNAIFDATGQRIRSLPMVPHGLERS